MTESKFTTELHLLSQVVLAGECRPALDHLVRADPEHRAAFHRAAHLHHVVVRAFRPLAASARACGESQVADWAETMLALEEDRIANVLGHGWAVCAELELAGCPTVVIKSLDHWPDIGNDLDLYTTANEPAVRSLLQRRFGAVSGPRTWGDRLAAKCGFHIPGMQATVEVHHGRLGQTGEHRALAQRFITRRVHANFLEHRFLVPAPEERVIAATLQRMYRHFYFRICDVANTAGLAERRELDYAELHRAATSAGILAGVSSYLNIVSTYLRQYGGRPLQLPAAITKNALFDGPVLFVRGPWLRVPVFSTAVPLYSKQATAMLLRRDLSGTLRLGLLPPLASAAKMAYLITGDHRGIW
jgi:hypothetical protein